MPLFRSAALLAASLLTLSPGAAAQVAEAGQAKPLGPAITNGFGESVSFDGTRLLLGARSDAGAGTAAGRAYVIERQPDGSWLQVQTFLGADTDVSDLLGHEVALRGDLALVGAPGKEPQSSGFGKGAAYFFERQPSGTWTEAAKLVPAQALAGDYFGSSVALSPSGLRAAVGAILDDIDTPFPAILNCGSVYLFEKQGGSWAQVAKIQLPLAQAVAQGKLGWRVALTNDRVFVTSQVGARVYDFGGALLQELTATGGTGLDGFGQDVHVDGSRLVVGAHGYSGSKGAAYVFEESGGTWSQVAQLVASDGLANDQFGSSVAIEGDRVAVGSPLADGVFPNTNLGRSYLFRRQPSGAWSETAKFDWPNSTGSANIGAAVALSGERIVACARNAHQVDGLLTGGAAYVWRDVGPAQFSFGTGTPGCAGPHAMTAGAAEIGSAIFVLRTDLAPDSALGLCVIGDVADLVGHDPFGIGILLHVDLMASPNLVALDIVSNSAGRAAVVVTIPDLPSLVGSTFNAQAIWYWGAAVCLPPYNLSSSPGVAFPILAP